MSCARLTMSVSIRCDVRLPEATLNASGKFFSSPAECTSGWLEMIRSTSVVPERGMPITKIGSSVG